MVRNGLIGRSIALALVCATAGLADEVTVMPATELTMDTLVITPSRSEQALGETAPAVSLVTREQLERKQVTTVADALREVPGVDVSESGPRGSVASVFVRGSSADEVLVLVDGVRANSTTLGSFDFSDLTPENIERIEVLRGWGGTLYGSEAVGGVIQIFTRKGSGPPRGSVSAAGGSGSTDREVAEFSGSSGIFSYSGSASHLRTEGFKPENDEYENTAVSARVDADAVENGSARVILRTGESEFGNFFSNNFLGGPDPDANQDRAFLITRGDWNHAPSPMVRYRLGASYSRDDLDFTDRPDAFETGSLDSTFLSEIVTGDGQANLRWWGERAESVFGVEYEEKSADVDSIFSDPAFGRFPSVFDEAIANVAGYTLQQIGFFGRRLVLLGGVRVDDNDRFGRAVSPSGGGSYTLAATATRLRATYAEGFKAPTLNELFFPGFGNPDLEAEESWEATAGLDQPLAEGGALVSASWFHREVDDLIEGVPQETGLFLAENVGRARIDGAEAALEVEILPGVRAGGEYTFLDIDASASGRARRPKHSGSVFGAVARDGLFAEGDTLSFDARLLLVGSRLDFDPAVFFAARENDAYQRADLAASYAFLVGRSPLRRVAVFVRIENLFDRDYEEVLGFGARPVNFLAGVKGELG